MVSVSRSSQEQGQPSRVSVRLVPVVGSPWDHPLSSMLIACQGCRLCGHRYSLRCYQSRGVHQRHRCCLPNAYYGHCLAVAYKWLAQKNKAYRGKLTLHGHLSDRRFSCAFLRTCGQV
jgi:hypothetical protein